MEWSIDEYTAYSEEESVSKASWILSKGLWLGKKVVMTGVVISSAPLVLPPLVVMSALGFAFSVPFGVIFASYTCAEKLMSKLLPMPASVKMLEYEPLLVDEAEVYMEEEEKMQKEDTMEEADMKIELVEDGKKLQEEGDVLPEKGENSLKNNKKVDEENFYNDESFKEKGYEEDVGDYLEGDGEGSLGGIDVKIQGQGQEVEKEPLTKESKNEKSPTVVKRVVVVVEEQKKSATVDRKTGELILVAREVRGDTESVEKVTENAEADLPKEETTGLVKKTRDEGNSGEPVKKNKKKNKHRLKTLHGVGGKEKAGGVTTKETEKPFKVGDDELNKLVSEIDKPDAEKRDEIIPEEEKGSMEATLETEGVVIKSTVVGDRENAEVTGKPIGYQSMLINGNHAKENPKIRDEHSKEKMAEERVQFRENQAKPVFPASKHDEVQCKEDATIPSSGVLPSEEKLWEQINTMRLIVGYKAACQPSFLEELKALYMFTGVDPPSSFGKNIDIRDAEDKLRFLMSIVGVK